MAGGGLHKYVLSDGGEGPVANWRRGRLLRGHRLDERTSEETAPMDLVDVRLRAETTVWPALSSERDPWLQHSGFLPHLKKEKYRRCCDTNA